MVANRGHGVAVRPVGGLGGQQAKLFERGVVT
jgi:hypothetical protein